MPFLADLNIKFCYRSDKDNLVRDFFVPALSYAVEYKRAVGFFSSSSLKSLSRGLEALLLNGGTMKIIASPQLSEEDATAIDAGYKERETECVSSCRRAVENLDWNVELEVLSWLIATGRLNIKLAMRANSALPGIYHEKLGIIKDANGDFITFSGSANESVSAHEYNFEALDVRCGDGGHRLPGPGAPAFGLVAKRDPRRPADRGHAGQSRVLGPDV